MISVTSVSGNVRDGGAGGGAGCERLLLRRDEMGRSRMRRSTDRGTDVGIELGGGAPLRHGDVLRGGGRTIVVEQLPELVASARPGGGADAMALVGHIVGNMHRPISVGGGAVRFPIQAGSELESLGALFAGVEGGVELEAGEMVFVPHGAAGAHGH